MQNWKQLKEIADNDDYKTIADLNRQAEANLKYRKLAVANFHIVADGLEMLLKNPNDSTTINYCNNLLNSTNETTTKS